MVLTAAIWLLFVVVTLWPPFRRGPLGALVFVLTMTMNEIPLVLLAVFGVAIAVNDRPVGVPATVAAAILAGVTSVGLERTRFGGHGRGLPVFPDRGECFHGFNAEKFHG